MRILITGGAGFIGSKLAARLLTLGHDITVLDNLSPQIHGGDPARTSPLYSSIADRVRLRRGSVCDLELVRECVTNQDLVCHLAAETGTGQSMYEVSRYVDVNVLGTACLLEALRRDGASVRRVVVASSRAVYGEGKYRADDGSIAYPVARKLKDLSDGKFQLYDPRSGRAMTPLPTDENSALHPTSVYGVTKLSQEQLVMNVCPTLKIEPVALRYQNVYGPGQALKNPYTGILSIFSTAILNGNPINVFEDGMESRDFVFIDDVVRATILALFEKAAGGHVFGIGSGVPTSVRAVAMTLVQKYRKEVPIQVTGDFRIGDIRHNYADLTLARQKLGFDPAVTFEEGIQSFTSWVLKQEVAQDQYASSLRELADRGLLNSGNKN